MKDDSYFYRVISKKYGILFESDSLLEIETQMIEDYNIRDCLEFKGDVQVMRYQFKNPENITKRVMESIREDLEADANES